MYIATIIIGILFVLLIVGCFVWFIIGDEPFAMIGAIMFTILGAASLHVIYFHEKNAIEYPYDKTYTIKLYYQDGGYTINYFNCKGWETPCMEGENSGYCFILGNYSIPCVTRYEIIKVENHIKKK